MFKNLTFASFLGLSAVILGAFGAHALQDILSIEGLKSFETAVKYQMYHALLLLFINTYQGFTIKEKNRLSYFLFIGILLFSGSIYLIQLTSITAKAIWFVTPLGGLFLIFAWLYLVTIFFKKSRNL